MKTKASIVSILIPCYNSAEYLADTLDSCLNQSYDNIEIIIVDDGSTDESLAIAKQYEIKQPFIKVYSQDNRGAPAARNLAFSYARGDYIQYLDADDILDKEKLSTQLEALANEGNDTVSFGSCRMFEYTMNDSTPYDTPFNRNYEDPKKFLIDMWSSATMVLSHSWLVHRSLVEKVGPWDEKLLKNQDGVFFAKVLSLASRVLFVKSSLVYYRIHNQNSVSRKKSTLSETSRLRSFEEYEELFRKELDRPEVKRALTIVYSYFIFDNYPDNIDLVHKAHQKIEHFGFKEPLNVNIALYKRFAPFLGIYGAIRAHKYLSRIKQTLLALTGRKK